MSSIIRNYSERNVILFRKNDIREAGLSHPTAKTSTSPRQLAAKLNDRSRTGFDHDFQNLLDLFGILVRKLFQEIMDFRVLRAVSERMRVRSVSEVQEVGQEQHLFALGLQAGVIAVELGHLRRHVADDPLNDVHRDSVQPGIVTERMTAAVKVLDRDGTITTCGLAQGDDVALLFQKNLDAVGNAAAVMQIHFSMKRQYVLGILAAVRPFFQKLFEVDGQRRHDRDVYADLRLAHLSSADDEVRQVDLAPLQRADVPLAQSRGNRDGEQRSGEIVEVLLDRLQLFKRERLSGLGLQGRLWDIGERIAHESGIIGKQREDLRDRCDMIRDGRAGKRMRLPTHSRLAGRIFPVEAEVRHEVFRMVTGDSCEVSHLGIDILHIRQKILPVSGLQSLPCRSWNALPGFFK